VERSGGARRESALSSEEIDMVVKANIPPRYFGVSVSHCSQMFPPFGGKIGRKIDGWRGASSFLCALKK